MKVVQSVAVIVRKGNKVLLGKRTKRYGFGKYQLPGGNIKNRELKVLGITLRTREETPEEAGRREVKEETGLDVEHLQYLTNVFKHDEVDDITYETFILETFVDADTEAQNLEPDKCAGWGWYELNDLPSPLFEITLALEGYIQ